MSRHDRLIQEFEHDPYHAKGKTPEPAACPTCGAIFHEGRWQWGQTPAGAHHVACPACRRTADRVPAGILTIGGEFFGAHRDELMHLVHNIAERQRAQHPLERIMQIEEQGGEMTITFTDPHLPRSVGEALRSAYDGELTLKPAPGEYFMRVSWHR